MKIASSQKTIRTLNSVALFRGLDTRQLNTIIEAGVQRKAIKNTFLFHQSQTAKNFYVVLEGKFKLLQVTEEGQQVILGYKNPGEAFAIIAVLSEIPYPISAQAVEDSTVLCWSDEVMLDLMNRYPVLAMNSIQILTNHIREFQDRFREIATERVERRIARALMRLAGHSGRKVDEGILIEMVLTRQDLAEMIGTTLYTVSRTLRQWEKQGLVKSKREQVTITSPHKLVRIAEELTK